MGLTLGEVVRRYGDEYQLKYGPSLLPSHRQVLRAIARCRTEALGGQVYVCPDCGTQDYKYHSCRNRHCPQCQYQQTQAWLQKQGELLLPTHYFLLTFTLPAGLRTLAQANQKLIYKLLFRVTAAASQVLAKDPHYVGGQLGMIGVLHTWTRNLAYHPHIHYLVTGGGSAADGVWQPARWARFLFPVKALSKLVRAKFRQALRKAGLEKEVPPSVWQQDWVVHCQPGGNGQTVLKYLAPYVFHVAISNRRLLALDDQGDMGNSRITFAYRTSDTGASKTMTLSVEAFLQRFLQHILPKGFVKVRYYGCFAPGCRKRLATLRQQLQPDLPTSANLSQAALVPNQTEETPDAAPICPNCGMPMRLQKTAPPLAHQPTKLSVGRSPP